MTQANLVAFCQLVLQDGGLQEKLRVVAERDPFVHQVVALGEQHGFCFSAEEVKALMQANRRAWAERRDR
jgi:hypothetical protein